MVEVLIDTNFIVTCMKQKIQMIEQFGNLFGHYDLIVPRQVLEELEKLKASEKLKVKDRESASVAVALINANNIKPTELATKDVDAGIIRYSKENPEVYIATLDRALKQKIKEKNRSAKFITIRKKTRIVIQ